VVFNEQDTDDEEDYEDDEVEDDDEENEDKRVEESNPAPSAQVTHGSPDLSGQRGVGNLSGPQTSNNLGSNGHGPSSGYGPPAGYDSTPQAQFSLPPSSTSQQPNSVIDRRSIGNQQQRYSMSGHTQSYSQTSRAPDAKPQYRAYSIGSPPAPSAYQAYGSNGIDAPKSQHLYSSNGQHDYAQNRGTNINANVGGETQQRSPEPQYGAYVAPEQPAFIRS
jgi:hypothetical protein